MQHLNIDPEDITDFDRKLARNQRALTVAKKIVSLTPEERAKRLQKLQQRIQEGTASLFEEKVEANLLEARRAELILFLSKQLPGIEPKIKTQLILQEPSPASPSPAGSASPKQAEAPKEYPSELLEFLATQKPPPPQASRQKQDEVVADERPKSSIWKSTDILVVAGCILLLIVAFWYARLSKTSDTKFTTFDQQAADEQSTSGLSKEAFQQMQTSFDEALQELRTGDFDQGKIQMLDFIETYPATSFAEDAYIALADTSRQRQNNPDEALKYYQTVLQRYPDSVHIGLVHLKMGFTYEDLRDYNSAAQMYRLVIQQHGETSRVGQLANERLKALQAGPE